MALTTEQRLFNLMMEDRWSQEDYKLADELREKLKEEERNAKELRGIKKD